MTEFLIGADPEFFIKDKKTGKHVSAFGMIPGTKRDPFHVDGGAVQVDGMALEFNINPASSAEQFVGNIKTVLEQLREMVPPEYEFDFVPVAHFGKEYIDAQPDAAKELGCDPDYNAWTGAINPKPNSDLGIRTASGHVHIGWTEQQDITDPDHIEACQMLTKQLDGYLGLPAQMWDHDTIRSSMYGAPGAYRPKHYGVEYRVLSNAWLTDEHLMKYVFNQSQEAAKRLLDRSRIYEVISIHKALARYGYRDLYSLITDYLPHADRNDYILIQDLSKKLWKRDRPAAIQYLEKYNSNDYFWNSSYELKHYSDVTVEEVVDGTFTCNELQVRRKQAGKPFLKYSEALEERRKEQEALANSLNSLSNTLPRWGSVANGFAAGAVGTGFNPGVIAFDEVVEFEPEEDEEEIEIDFYDEDDDDILEA